VSSILSVITLAGCFAPSGDEVPNEPQGERPDALSAHRPNVDSPIGTNLATLNGSSNALIDAFKQAQEWKNVGAVAPLDLDANGWVKSLSPGQVTRARAVLGDGVTQAGKKWTLTYEGKGTLNLSGQVTVLASSAHQIDFVSEASPSSGALAAALVDIAATDPTDPVRNIHILPEGGICRSGPFVSVKSASDCAAATDYLPFATSYSTLLFTPEFLAGMRSFRVVRFMDWMRTNDSTQQDWATRPKMSNATWGTDAGVPLEVMIALSNRLGADPWFNIPHQATDDYVKQFGTVVKARLNPILKAHVEYSNEVWNGSFGQTAYCGLQAAEAPIGIPWKPSAGSASERVFYGKRSAEIFTILEPLLGPDRLVRIVATRAYDSGNAKHAERTFEFPGVLQHVDAIAIAPYLRMSVSMTNADSMRIDTVAEVDEVLSMSLDQAHARMEKNLEVVQAAVHQMVAVAKAKNLRLVTYEGGQHLLGGLNLFNAKKPDFLPPAKQDQLIQKLRDINMSPGMKTVYDDYLTLWLNETGDRFVNFNDIGRTTKYGSWGAQEYLAQPRSEAPKYDALLSFIDAHRGATP
jgi:hypothetical protein